MARRAWDISDEFWAAVEPLLPARERRFRYPGRKPIEDRAVLQGIIFVLVTGIPWKALPIELGFGSGQTCHRRLCEWTEAGVWPALHAELLKRLRQADQLDWDRVCIDASHVQAKKGGATTGPSPVNRGKPGAKHHLIVDGSGIPLAYSTTPGNRHDVSQLWPLLDRIPRVAGRIGRPRHKPRRLYADRGYDYPIHRRRLTSRGIPHSIARRGHPHGSGLGEIRYVVERSFAWLHRHRRLATCYERRPDIHDALFGIGCILICWRHLERSL
jgi:transposase